MNNDVLKPVGGYLLVDINEEGYIHSPRKGHPFYTFHMVHKETRGMNQWFGCMDSLEIALPELRKYNSPPNSVRGLLSLTPEGGGESIFVEKDTLTEWKNRLTTWRGCYGIWPVYVLSS